MKALRKDFIIEIKKTFPRFLSILFIVTLGVAFFSGLRGASKDMRLSLDEYFDEKNLYDLQVVSTLGLTEDDVNALEQIEGVKQVEAGYDKDLLCELDEIQYVLNVRSNYETMNECRLEEGEWATDDSECVVDDYFAEETGLKIGDTITLQSGEEDEEVTDTIARETYTISGFASAPMYVSYERETSSIGQGIVDGFVLLNKKQFVTDYYTQIDLTLDGALEEIAYTEEYDAVVDEIRAVLEDETAQVRTEARYEEVVSEANAELADAKEELAEAQQELEDGNQELLENEETLKQEKADAYDQLADTYALLTSQQSQLAESEATLAQSYQDLVNGQTTLDAAKADLDEKQSELNDSQAELDKSQKTLDKSQKSLDSQLATLNAQKAALVAQGIPEAMAQTQLADFYNEISAAQAQIDSSQKQIDSAQKTIDQGQLEINAGYEQIKAKQTELNQGMAAYQTGATQLADGKSQLADGWSQYYAGYEEAETSFAEADEKIADAKQELEDGKQKIEDAQEEIADAEKEIADIEYPTWYVFDRNDLPQYSQGGENADRIAAISKVFPAIFFLVAALISLTTMTRMVEEERTIIGTYKALGYSKWSIAGKYLLYALFATVGGSLAGILFGQKFLPWVIVYCYQMMYMYIPNIVVPYQIVHGATAMILAIACTVGAAWAACYGELLASPAKLMRPVTPKAGQRVWIEKITFLWKRLTFSQKAALRNMFRYKKRLFMTIFGIGGCMGLMLVGYGVKDSISVLGDKQYAEIFQYDGIVVYDDGYESAIVNRFEENEEVERACNLALNNVDVKSDIKTATVYLNVLSNDDVSDFQQMISLQERRSGDVINLTDEGAVITEKLSTQMNVTVGDSINIEIDNEIYPAKVTGITEQYLNHYVYMTDTYYKELTGETSENNAVYYSTKDHDSKITKQIGAHMLQTDGVLQVMYAQDMRGTLDTMFGSLNLVVVVLIVAAGLLAFVVLYNLNNININERKRELASIRVLGFYNRELAAYVYRENVLITIIGIVFGWGFGAVLHRFIITTVEVDNCMFGRSIFFQSYIYSALWTALFAFTVNLVMYFKLKKIDMIESLKSVE